MKSAAEISNESTELNVMTAL